VAVDKWLLEAGAAWPTYAEGSQGTPAVSMLWGEALEPPNSDRMGGFVGLGLDQTLMLLSLGSIGV
jgi:hypothetical protein